MEKLREELAKLLFDWIDDDGWEWWEVDKEVRDHYRGKVDSILSLLDAQRCVWTYTDGGYETSCDSWLFQEQAIHPYCPACGKRIEVKDVEKG